MTRLARAPLAHTIEQAAARMGGVSVAEVSLLIESGVLGYVLIGNQLRVTEAAIRQFLRAGTRKIRSAPNE